MLFYARSRGPIQKNGPEKPTQRPGSAKLLGTQFTKAVNTERDRQQLFGLSWLAQSSWNPFYWMNAWTKWRRNVKNAKRRYAMRDALEHPAVKPELLNNTLHMALPPEMKREEYARLSEAQKRHLTPMQQFDAFGNAMDRLHAEMKGKPLLKHKLEVLQENGYPFKKLATFEELDRSRLGGILDARARLLDEVVSLNNAISWSGKKDLPKLLERQEELLKTSEKIKKDLDANNEFLTMIEAELRAVHNWYRTPETKTAFYSGAKDYVAQDGAQNPK